MKRNSIICFVMALLVFFSGCSITDEEQSGEPEFIDVIENKTYSIMHIFDGYHFAGSTPVDSGFIACNTEDSKLCTMNYSGEIEHVWGQLGNGENEFLHPTSIVRSGDYFYVLDAGNKRVQIYNNDMHKIRTIELEELENTNEVYYLDLSVSDKGVIYITTNSPFDDTSRIYIVNAAGELVLSKKPMHGFTYCDDNVAYCVNTFETVETEEAITSSFSHSYLYVISEDGSMEIKTELPYKYGPADFIVDGDDLYILSSAWGRLDHFTTNGEYLETICWFENGLYPESYLSQTENGFVVTDCYVGVTYIISK